MINNIKIKFEKTLNESPNGGLSDQKYVNEYVKINKNFRYHLLPWKKYASGKQYLIKIKNILKITNLYFYTTIGLKD